MLGHFIRYQRTSAARSQFPVPVHPHARTPGLTREELAELAHVSVDWLTRIEQGRTHGIPSADVLTNLATALHLDPAATDYLLQLTGQPAPQAAHTKIASDTAVLLASFGSTPAFVMDTDLAILTVNPAYQRLFGWQQDAAPLHRNLLWRVFYVAAYRDQLSDWQNYAAYLTAVFRELYSRASESAELHAVFEAVKDKPEFAKPWQALAVAHFKPQHLILNADRPNTLYLVETTLIIPAQSQLLVVDTPGDDASQRALTSAK